ncbi:putative quinol monooxygenase [Parerythrobacter aestuarii]|uniref:putative quinol monooxygenase n=1 Tax=Parerythrobacter aestuarii TaxID=3020909 RepID=UPI0024DE9F6D|nr:putative quinol monooxygenase [Parerythrobacter aestuarii]
MIIITGTVQLKPESREDAIRLGCEHSARSRGEPGCLAHNCYVDAEDELRIHFFEKWADEAAVKQHFAVPESRAFVGEISGFASAPPQIELFAARAVEGTPF